MNWEAFSKASLGAVSDSLASNRLIHARAARHLLRNMHVPVLNSHWRKGYRDRLGTMRMVAQG
jgi:hypothetical protein